MSPGRLVVVAMALLATSGCSLKGGSAATTTSATTRAPLVGVGSSGTSTQATIAVASTAPPVATSASITSAQSSAPTTVAGRSVSRPDDNVKKGDRGDGVSSIQKALVAAGFKVAVDGDFGSKTDAAVRSFQEKNGLTVDGVVGPKTWAKLKSGSTTATTAKSATVSSTTAKTAAATTTTVKP